MIEFKIPDSVETRFANEVAIQTVHTEFIFSFFEVRIPIVRSAKTTAEINSEIRPVCVARIAMSAERIPAIIEGLQERFDQFVAAGRQPVAQDTAKEEAQEEVQDES